MKNYLEKLIKIIKKSIISPDGKESSTRIGSYFLLLLIVIMIIIFSGIELYHAYINKGVISNESIIIFGMILTHHLALQGINKHHESKNINKSTKPNKII